MKIHFYRKRTVVIIHALFLIMGIKTFSQEIVIPKDTIFLKYRPNDGTVPHYRGKKFKSKNGINFNLYEGNGLFYPNHGDSDTLPINYLKFYRFTEIKDLESLDSLWYRKNLPDLTRKYGDIIPPYDKNGKFVTYLIEEFNDCLIKYRVHWRNEHVID